MNEAGADIESKKEILGRIQKYAYTFSKYTYRSALAQFYRANYWANWNLILGLASTILSVIAGASILSRYQEWETAAGFMALAASALIAISTFLNPNRRKQDHYNAATSFLDISDKARFLSEVESRMNIKENDELKNELFKLVIESGEQTKNSPRIPTKPWDDAKKGVKKHFERAQETFYVTVKEKDFPIGLPNHFKVVCSGGCGDEVWEDKKWERIWSEVPVLCLECALKKMEFARASKDDISFDIAPESTESLMKFFMERDKTHKS